MADQLEVYFSYFDIYSWFEYFIMTCILINSITIPAHDFQDNEDKTERNKRLHLVQVVIQGVYCFELMLKIMAMGLLHRRKSAENN